MRENIKKVLIAEKIPVIVCAAACLTSVFLGFVFGFIFWGQVEPLLVYGETSAVYQPSTPHLATVPEGNYQPAKTPVPAPENAAADSRAASHLYVVTVLGGYIAIFHADENGGGLKEITGTAVGALSAEELEQLTEGIKIYSEEALSLILQDYGS